MQKCVNLVNLVKRFQTSSHLQKSASIEPRTGRSTFADTYCPKVNIVQLLSNAVRGVPVRAGAAARVAVAVRGWPAQRLGLRGAPNELPGNYGARTQK